MHRRRLKHPKGYKTVTELERDLGLKSSGLHKFLERHDLTKQCEKIGKYRYVPTAIFEQYLETTERDNVTRVSVKPKGWWNLKQAVDFVGCCTWLIHEEVRRGRIRAVRMGHANLYHPEDVKTLKASYDTSPPEDYLEVRQIVKPLKADHQSALVWMKRKGYQVKKFRRDNDKQFAWFTPKVAAEAFKHYHTSLQKPRRLTQDEAKRIRTLNEQGWSRVDIALELNTSVTTVRYVILGLSHKETLEHDLPFSRSSGCYKILRLLRNTSEPTTTKYMGHVLSISESNLHTSLNKLVKRGYVNKVGRAKYQATK